MANMLIQEDPAIKRKKEMAQAFMDQGASTAPVSSPFQALARVLTGYLGNKAYNNADAEQKAREQGAQNTIAEALKAYQGKYTPDDNMVFDSTDTVAQDNGWKSEGGMDALVQVLAGNKDTANLATQFKFQDIENQESRKTELAKLLYKAQMKDATTAAPSNVREWEYYSQLSPADQERFLQMKRSAQTLNLGGSYGITSQANPGQLQANIPKTLPPEATPEVKGAQTQATEQAKLNVEMPKLRRAATNALSGLERQTNIVNDNIDKALKLISPLSTGYGSMLSFLPETDARELKNTLDTIKANVGFDKLQQLRDNSPTGGALGQVSEMENRLLQATSGALDPGQSDQLRENLQTIKDLYNQVLKEKRSAFQTDFGGAEQETKIDSATPTPQETKSIGGKTYIKIDGQWYEQ